MSLFRSHRMDILLHTVRNGYIFLHRSLILRIHHKKLRLLDSCLYMVLIHERSHCMDRLSHTYHILYISENRFLILYVLVRLLRNDMLWYSLFQDSSDSCLLQHSLRLDSLHMQIWSPARYFHRLLLLELFPLLNGFSVLRFLSLCRCSNGMLVLVLRSSSLECDRVLLLMFLQTMPLLLNTVHLFSDSECLLHHT